MLPYKKAQRAENIADTLKKEVDKKGMIDVSEGANLVMGVSQSELDDAASDIYKASIMELFSREIGRTALFIMA